MVMNETTLKELRPAMTTLEREGFALVRVEGERNDRRLQPAASAVSARRTSSAAAEPRSSAVGLGAYGREFVRVVIEG